MKKIFGACFSVLSLFPFASSANNRLQIKKTDNQIELSWTDWQAFVDEDFQKIFPKYEIQGSPDLKNWFVVAQIPHRESNQAKEHVLKRDLLPEGKEFFRLVSTVDLPTFENSLAASFNSPVFF